MPINSIVIIGSGNVATHLGKAFYQHGKVIRQVFSRNISSAAMLAEAVDAEPVSRLDDIECNADLCLIAVPDDAIAGVIAGLSRIDGIIAHTSGSTGIDVMENHFRRFGVLYPLQTISKNREIDFSDVPFCIEASGKEVQYELLSLAAELSEDVRIFSSYERAYIHLAAVIVCNFTNYLYSLGEAVLSRNGIPFDILKPLIFETAAKIRNENLRNVQTGPAARHDMQVISKHLALLKNDPAIQSLYSDISRLIMQWMASGQDIVDNMEK